jgi:hypothetical protein
LKKVTRPKTGIMPKAKIAGLMLIKSAKKGCPGRLQERVTPIPGNFFSGHEKNNFTIKQLIFN